ncbi:piggyBac transposable element-derived protein 4-like [Schistocerca serialis cubense]|uniref:piggyBac transposable element-derived protein 4-like n=1 Tax=Schistocerca serialis cubense TaxID=2023355 RepID=UPI00214EC29A|nr:piggyBac transposable element-derived protein 4-like [Schistocerca serialis cubense]
MKNKPNKYGIKLYALCDSSTGYMLNCDACTGSAGSVDNRLRSQYFGKGHCIYMDRYYTCPSLLDMLWENKALGVGTVMKNRKGLRRIFRTLKLKKKFVFQTKFHLLSVKWKSERDVVYLSTKHKSTSTSIQVRAKGGIAEIVNFILCKENTRKNVSLVDVIHRVGKKLAEKGGNIFHQPAASSSQIERTFARHFPEKVPPTANKVNTTRNCKLCSDRGKKETGKRIRKENRWWCKACGIGLCSHSVSRIFTQRLTTSELLKYSSLQVPAVRQHGDILF